MFLKLQNLLLSRTNIFDNRFRVTQYSAKLSFVPEGNLFTKYKEELAAHHFWKRFRVSFTVQFTVH